MRAGEDGTTQRPLVLIVEDESLVAMLLTDIVEEAGCDVAGPATGAEEALRLAEEQRPDLAIVDVSLQSSRDGVEIAAELNRRGGTAVIFMSGHDGVEDWHDVQQLDPVAVLRKPCMPDRIEEAIRLALRERGKA